jgi:hypothetical protein
MTTRKIVLTGCLVVAAGCTAAAAPADTGLAELRVRQLELVLSAIGVGGAAVAFLIGLRQYRRAEQWKRAEFISSETKEFFANPRVGLALTMVDWSGREIPLSAVRDPADRDLTYVTREMQCWALLPHTALNRVAPGHLEDQEAKMARASENSLIRDCYDALLDGFERFGSYLKSGLVSVDELRPYIGYWIDDIAAPPANADEAAWTACLLVYIDTYGYSSVRALFAGFGYDIGLNQPLFATFLNATENQRLAALLRSR